MVKETRNCSEKKKNSLIIFFLTIKILILLFLCIFIFSFIYFFEKKYENKIYPGIKIDGIDFGGKTKEEIENYFLKKSAPFSSFNLLLKYDEKIATLSGKDLKIAYDEKLASTQLFSLGRTGNFLADLYHKWKALTVGINLTSTLKMENALIEETLDHLSILIDIPPQDALFQFEKGKVTAFRLSKTGRKLNKETTKKMIYAAITQKIQETKNNEFDIPISLPIEIQEPRITTENSNKFGIKELIGRGDSKFLGSIAGRIHNLTLASARLNGQMIAPEEIFSFNNALGDVSAATGYQPAYIIKEGRTVLGDGGGVCQVSTTLFRAALNAGLPIIERFPHSYRVSYYEQDSPPGLDATVFAPNYDLKFKNDTQNYILIQAKVEPTNYTLTFELYGTFDGRKVEITKPIIYSQIPPPPDLYQDDPTLPKGVVKQVDWKAWGAKVSFDYKVIKGGEILFQKTFFSNYQPWQAVFLRGIRE